MPPADPPSREDFAAHPHDSLVQRFLTRPEVAAVQLRVALPAALTSCFDWPTLRIASGTYIDPKLRPRRGDILYAVELTRAFMRLAYAPDQITPEHVAPLIPLLDVVLRDYGEEDLQALLTYVLSAFGPESPLRDILYDTASQETREVITTYRDQYIAEGEARGEAKGMATMLLRLLDQRNLPLPLELEHQVSHCQDPAQLQRWFDRALQAARIEDVFAD